MISAQTLTNVRTFAFAAGGLICAAYALAALVGVPPHTLPHWLPLASAICIFLVFFFTAACAGRQNTDASLDESYQSDRKSAASLGFWTAIVIGTALWLLNIGGDLQLAITLTTASAAFFLCQVTLELRGRR